MKTFEIIEKGNTRSRLTVTPTRVTIKLADNCDKERVVGFLTEVANQLSDVTITMRGGLEVRDNHPLSIQMTTESKKDRRSFRE